MTEPGDRVASPGSLIVTFVGLHLRRIGGWIPVADLIRFLADAGVTEPAVRQALTRLKSRDFLVTDRRDGAAGYRLGSAAAADLRIGDERIFRYGEAAPDTNWVLAIFSVPERDRAVRHRIRSGLAWRGFGTVAAGVWIAPAALAERTREQFAADGLGGYVTWFVGRPLTAPDVAAWWDLETLAVQYRSFLSEWGQFVGGPVADPAETTGRHLRLVDAWRQFPRIDPGLPAALLPADWPGRAAFATFRELHERWFPIARRRIG